LNRRVIEINTGGTGAARGGDAANRDVVRTRIVDVDSGSEAGDFLEVLDTADIQGFLSHRGDADGNLAEAFFVTSRRHHDFRQRAGCFVGGSRIGAHRARRQGGEDNAHRTHGPHPIVALLQLVIFPASRMMYPQFLFERIRFAQGAKSP